MSLVDLSHTLYPGMPKIPVQLQKVTVAAS